MSNTPRITLDMLHRDTQRDPDSSKAAHALAGAYDERREFRLAYEHHLRATELEPGNAAYQRDLANACKWLKRPEEERQALVAAHHLEPENVDFCYRLATLAEREDDIEAARRYFLHAARHKPEDPDAHAGVCRSFLSGRSARHALALAARALGPIADGQRPALLGGLALALESHGRYPEARTWWRRRLAAGPASGFVTLQAANAHIAVREMDAAEELHARAIALQPEHPPVIMFYVAYLFRTGQKDRAARLIREPATRRSLQSVIVCSQPTTAPEWIGTGNIAGKHVLLNCLGAIGDNVQFSRFARLLASRGARITVQCLPSVREILRTIPGVESAISPYDECEAADYQCRADLLMYDADWNWEWAAETSPYLRVSEANRERWRHRLGDHGLKIGLVWNAESISMGRGCPGHKRNTDTYRYRSVPLQELRPLASIPGARIFGLQVGAGTAEITAVERQWMEASLEDETRPFTDAAAAIASMDAVVTIDSGLSHIAGALGTRAFLLLPYFADFRWMVESPGFQNGGRTPWYPGMTAVQQETPGRWDTTIAQVVRILQAERAAEVSAATWVPGRSAPVSSAFQQTSV